MRRAIIALVSGGEKKPNWRIMGLAYQPLPYVCTRSLGALFDHFDNLSPFFTVLDHLGSIWTILDNFSHFWKF